MTIPLGAVLSALWMVLGVSSVTMYLSYTTIFNNSSIVVSSFMRDSMQGLPTKRTLPVDAELPAWGCGCGWGPDVEAVGGPDVPAWCCMDIKFIRC